MTRVKVTGPGSAPGLGAEPGFSHGEPGRSVVTAAIAARNLTKLYPGGLGRCTQRSLDALTLDVAPGETFGFLGRNGAGKTTTIKILCSLLRATSGEAYLFGERVPARGARAHLGYLPENPYFYEYLTPRETLDFYGRLHGLNAAGRAQTWNKLADILDLGPIANQRVRGFSKGMRQRLGFAVAMVGDPPLLILDEPMSGLDPLGRRSIRELILRLAKEGKTLFFSSHVLGDVEQTCSRVGILVQGRLRAQGHIEELLTRELTRVEVIAQGFTDENLARLRDRATCQRVSEAGYHFEAPGIEAANELVQHIQEAGGHLIEFTPVKESLEEYFVRQQEKSS